MHLQENPKSAELEEGEEEEVEENFYQPRQASYMIQGEQEQDEDREQDQGSREEGDTT